MTNREEYEKRIKEYMWETDRFKAQCLDYEKRLNECARVCRQRTAERDEARGKEAAMFVILESVREERDEARELVRLLYEFTDEALEYEYKIADAVIKRGDALYGRVRTMPWLKEGEID